MTPPATDRAELGRLKQGTFPVAENPWLRKLFGREVLARSQVANCIWIDHGDRLELVAGGCWQGRLDDSGKLPRTARWRGRFKGWLIENPPRGFKDVLYLLDCYRLSCRDFVRRERPALPRLRSALGRAVESLLAGSRGRVIWDWQLEHLAILCSVGEEPEPFRKGINAQRPESHDLARHAVIEPGVTLADLLAAWMVVDAITVSPDLRGAMAVCRLLLTRGRC